MPKVKVKWSIEVTETYEAEVEYDDLVAAAEDYDIPTLAELGADEEVYDGEAFGEMDSFLAGLEVGEPESATVENRFIDSIQLIKS